MDYAVDPINVKGARPGDTLCTEMPVIDLVSQGMMITSVGLGVSGGQTTEPDTKIAPVHNDFAHFLEDIKLPLTPMIGVMDAVPKEKKIRYAVPEDRGANMDTKPIAVDPRAYLPVDVQGVGFAIDDMHVYMGDEELSGIGVKIAGRMCPKTVIYRNRPIERPVIGATDGLYFLVSKPTLEGNVRIAASDTVQSLMKKLRLNFSDAYHLLSATCDTQIREAVGDNVTVRIHYPKFHVGIQVL